MLHEPANRFSAPEMDYQCDIEMWNKGRHDRWNTARDPGMGMSYFTREDLPYYYTLYDNFATGDQYFQSTYTATNPNRSNDESFIDVTVVRVVS
jgi:phospholipase C